jgi:IS30 family transposase
MVFTTNPFLGADLLPSIAYSERIKSEIFCELSLSNIQMTDRLNRSPATIFYELSRCQPYQAKLT